MGVWYFAGSMPAEKSLWQSTAPKKLGIFGRNNMEQEHFLSGYCRTTDQSRTVTVVTEDGELTEVDCCFETCIHAPNCTVAAEIRAVLKEK